MINPSLDELLEKVDSRYTLVMKVAKRARQIANNPKLSGVFESEKPVLAAINEVKSGKVKHKRFIESK